MAGCSRRSDEVVVAGQLLASEGRRGGEVADGVEGWKCGAAGWRGGEVAEVQTG